MDGLRAQSAMEYLLTYGWAFLIIAVVLAAMFELGLFNPGKFSGNECLLQAGFSCLNFFILPNGLLTINLEQATQSSLNITGYNCTEGTSIILPKLTTANQIYLPVGSNSTISMLCYTSTGSVYTSNPGQLYTGTLAFNYTELDTGFPHQTSGKISVSVQ